MLYNTQNPHGGDVYGAAVTLDFSSNVHPLGTPPGVAEAIRAAAAQVRQYPDPYCRALTAAIAAHEGVPQSTYGCGGGAAEQGPHPGLQLQDVEGLGHIVVRPALKAHQLVHVCAPSGEHDDGHIGKGSDLHTRLQPVQLGHHQV